MGEIKFTGIKGLTANDRAQWEKDNINELNARGYNSLADKDKQDIFKSWAFKAKFGNRSDYNVIKNYTTEQKDSLYNSDKLDIAPIDTRTKDNKRVDSLKQAYNKDVTDYAANQENYKTYSNRYSKYPGSLNKDWEKFDKFAQEASPYFKKYAGSEYLPLDESTKVDLMSGYKADVGVYGQEEAAKRFANKVQTTVSKKQPLSDKLIYGVQGAGTTLVGSTIAGIGTILAAVASPINQVVNEGYDNDLNFLQNWGRDIMDNPFTRYGNKVMQQGHFLNLSDDTNASNPFEIVRTAEEVNGSLADNIFSVNTVPELVSQSGFTIGAMLQGAGLSALGNRVFNTVKYATLSSKVGATVEQIENINRRLQFISQLQKGFNAFAVPGAVGSIEGSIEGLNTKLTFLEDAKMQIAEQQQEAINKAMQSFFSNPDEAKKLGFDLSTQDGVEQLQKYIFDSYQPIYEDALKKAERNADIAGLNNFVLNSGINGFANIMFKNALFSPSVRGALERTKVGKLFKSDYFTIVDDKVTAKDVSKWKQGIDIFKEMFGEFGEEYSQNITDAFARGGAEASLANYLEQRYNGVANDAINDSLADNLGAAFAAAGESAISKETILAGVYGAMSQAIGTPTINRRALQEAGESKSSKALGVLRTFYRNPIIEQIISQRNDANIQKQTAETINSWLEQEGNLDKYNSLAGSISWANEMFNSAKEGDEFSYRNNRTGKLVNDALMIQKLKGTELYNSIIENYLGVLNIEEGSEEAAKIEEDNGISLDVVKQNAQRMLDTFKSIQEASEDLDKSLGNSINPEVKQALIFGKINMKDWTERATQLEDELNKIEVTGNTEFSDEQKATIARLGSLDRYNIPKQQENINKLNKEIEVLSKNGAVLTDKQKESLKAKKKQLKQLSERLQLSEAAQKKFDKKDAVLSEVEIMSLLPQDRYKMLNPKNKDNYSAAQQAIIDNLIAKGTVTTSDFMNKVEDAARINKALEGHLVEYNYALSNPKYLDMIANYLKIQSYKENLNKKFDSLNKIDNIADFTQAIQEATKNSTDFENNMLYSKLKHNPLFKEYQDISKTFDGIITQLEENDNFRNVDKQVKDGVLMALSYLQDKGINPNTTNAISALLDNDGQSFSNYVNNKNAELDPKSRLVIPNITEIIDTYKSLFEAHTNNTKAVEAVTQPVEITSTTTEDSKPPKPVGVFAQIQKNPEMVADRDLREGGNVKPNSDTVGGSPVALEYLLEGGKGSIESAGYFLHAVAAAFPAITNAIEAIRNNIDSNTLGLNPSSFVITNHNSIFQIEALISSTYGKPGLDIYRELLSNSTGFYPRDGKVISNKIESLQPINSSSTINIINKYQTNSNEEVANSVQKGLSIIDNSSSMYDEVKEQATQIIDELGDSEYESSTDLSEAIMTKANQIQAQVEAGGDRNDKVSSLLKQVAAKMKVKSEVSTTTKVEEAKTQPIVNGDRRNNSMITTADVDKHPQSVVGQASKNFKMNDYLRKGHITPKTPIMFIADPAIISGVKQEMGESYNEEDHLPIMAVVEDSNGPIIIGDKKYQPIGFMPRTSANSQGAARMEPVRLAGLTQQDGTLLKDKDGKVITTNGYVRANPPEHTKAGTPNTLIHTIMSNDMDSESRDKMNDDNLPIQERQSIYRKFKNSILSNIRRVAKDAKGERIHLAYFTSNMKGGEQEFELYVTTPQNSFSRTGKPMVQVLTEGTPEELLKANSRLNRYGKTLEEFFKKKPFSDDIRFKRDNEVLVPVGEGESKLKALGESLTKKLSNYITIPKGYEYVFIPTEELLEGSRMYQLSLTNGTNTIPLAKVTNGTMTDSTKAQVIKSLFLDNNNFRYENNQPFAKWQVNYNDFDAKEGESEDARKIRLSNASDIFDDNILESSRTSLKYTIRGIDINSPFKQDNNRTLPTTPVVTNQDNASSAKPINTPVITANDQVKVGNAIVDSESGAVLQGEVKSTSNQTADKAKDIADRIIEDSKSIRLSDDNSGYVDDEGRRYARVTSIIQADETAGERFDPNSPWITPSTNIGTSVDEFVRDFFAGEFTGEDGKLLNDYLYDYPNATQADWRAFANQLVELKNHLDAKGLTIIPRDVTVTGTVKVTDTQGQVHEVPVAGTLGLLAYDAQGNFHIFDIETNRSGISEEERKKYSKKVSMYQKFLEDKYGIKVASLNIIHTNVTYFTPLGFRDGKIKYEVSEGNQLLANGKEFKNAEPILEEVGSVPYTDVNIQYDKLTDSEKQMITDMLPADVKVEKTEIVEPETVVNKNLGIKMSRVKNRFANPAKKGNLVTPSSNNWELLSDDIREAAIQLGYTKESWNNMTEEEKQHQKECLS